jgi:hypothetical protein
MKISEERGISGVDSYSDTKAGLTGLSEVALETCEILRSNPNRYTSSID